MDLLVVCEEQSFGPRCTGDDHTWVSCWNTR